MSLRYYKRKLGAISTKFQPAARIARVARFRRQYRKAKGQFGASQGTHFNGRNTNKIMRNPGSSVIPPRYQTRLTFHQVWADTDADGFAAYQWRANGMYDPDVAVGGNVTPGLAALGTLWKYYKVSACRIEVDVVNNDADDAVHASVGPYLTGTISTAAHKEEIAGSPNHTSMVVCNQTGQGHLVNFMTTATAHGVKDIDDVGFQASYDADPTHQWYWTLYLWNHSGNALACEVSVTLTFYAEFSGMVFGAIAP